MDYLNDRHKSIHVIDGTTGSLDGITDMTSNFKKYCFDTWKLDEEQCGPAAKILVASIKWLHGVGSFVNMKPPEQTSLLHSKWKELFILAAAEYSFYFEGIPISHFKISVGNVSLRLKNFFYKFSDTAVPTVSLKRPYIKEEVKKLTYLLKRLSQCRLDRSEYDWMKSTLLFRTG